MGDESSSSVDSANKRGREEDGIEGIFKKSRKTTRSPLKTHKASEEKLDKILGIMQEMKTEMMEMRKEQREYREEMIAMRRENENLRKDCEITKRENQEIKNELNGLKKAIDRLEGEKREKNIVMTGMTIDSTDPKILTETVSNFLKEHLGVRVEIKSAHRLGQKTCLIQLNNVEDKENIMYNKHKLKKLEGETVYINNDLSVTERDMQRQIREKAREERKLGKTVKIGFSKVTINGEEWKWNRRTTKLEKSKN